MALYDTHLTWLQLTIIYTPIDHTVAHAVFTRFLSVHYILNDYTGHKTVCQHYWERKTTLAQTRLHYWNKQWKKNKQWKMLDIYYRMWIYGRQIKLGYLPNHRLKYNVNQLMVLFICAYIGRYMYQVIKRHPWNKDTVCALLRLSVIKFRSIFVTVTPREHYGVTNHWRLECVFSRLSWWTTEKTLTLYITGLLWGESVDVRRILITKGQKYGDTPCHDATMLHNVNRHVHANKMRETIIRVKIILHLETPENCPFKLLSNNN